ncbi:ATP-binding protein [Dyadobacter chenwenxiniae]|uniref:histidine kinase n=1 Tax=Dyadobacter chenwenxiniae TaxID=2906456 RepID=A0A9X1PNU4_9BACT|nr:sensor histidine kinase [Dyadobacter chenwenxiniae]MCF0063434.1 ATP-binding protein [Dyadobacter chenwenxiniae]UON85187.1 ATP-binding protein [Dyadobacter chenwenxiniae]
MWRKALKINPLLIILILLPGLKQLRAQQINSARPEVGRPLSGFYQSAEYHAHGQNFAITQDKSGVMYFANFAGVLEYDGVSWKTIQTTNVTRVSALATDAKNRVLVGANGEFGYLGTDAFGAHRFVDLSSKLKAKFGQIIQIIPTKSGAWFVTDGVNFLWNGSTVKPFQHNLRIQAAFPLKGEVLVYAKNKGIMLVDGNQFSKIAQNANVPALLDLISVVQLTDGSALLVTTSQGIFRLRNNRIEVMDGNANPVLMRNQATYAAKLQDGTIAVSMATGGMLVMNAQGNVQYPVYAGADLEESQVAAMFTDREQNLWLALNDGIARFDLPSPISVFGNEDGLRGSVTAVRRFEGRIVIGTLYGLYYIENNKIVHVNGFSGSCLGFDEANGSLYIASNKGLFRWSKNAGITRITSSFSLSITVSKSGNLFVGMQDGLARLVRAGNGWQPGRVASVNEQIVGVTEFPAGTFWLETLSNGIIKLDEESGTVKRFSAAQGISSPLYNKLALYQNRLMVSNKDGLFEYQPQSDRFARANWLHAEKTWFDRIQGDHQGNIWTTRGDKKSASLFKKKPSGKFELVETPLLPIADVPFQVIFPDEQGNAWLGGDRGLYRLDMQVRDQYVYEYPVLLRSVATQDSLLEFAQNGEIRKTLGHRQNNLIFEFALPSYHSNQEVDYQYILENYDKEWSDWGALTRKEYSGLPSGTYTFKVRAKDVYNHVSKETSLTFKIRVPWFRQWYMIALYLILFGLMIYYTVRWRLRSILREKEELETRIRERTEEVVNQKEELELQSEELSATNDQLERIDEFVKSINGEVNTGRLFQLVLNKLCEFQNVNGASALVYNKAADNYQFIALAGAVENAKVDDIRLTSRQAEQRYVEDGEEILEDIFLKNDFRSQNADDTIDELFSPKSLITILIRVDGYVKSYITLENTDRENAFSERDFNVVKNLKEHLIGAYIKTNILENLENTLSNLKSTQEELIRQERLASVGSLTKGIVDRILNPLNYINNFSQSSGKLLKEITEVTDKHQDGLSEDEKDDLDSGFEMLQKNLEKIYEHGNSTTRIVKDMQKLLKGKSTDFMVTELNPFLEAKARSAIQEVLNEYKDAAVKLELELYSNPVKVSLLPYEFAQVLVNVISNACYALLEKARVDKAFEPLILISSKPVAGGILVTVRDNGKGIPAKEQEQLFNPFFTTKPTSKGTGLGLYMSKDIIEYHKGRMSVNSLEGVFTEIEIFLPVIA